MAESANYMYLTMQKIVEKGQVGKGQEQKEPEPTVQQAGGATAAEPTAEPAPATAPPTPAAGSAGPEATASIPAGMEEDNDNDDLMFDELCDAFGKGGGETAAERREALREKWKRMREQHAAGSKDPKKIRKAIAKP